MSIKIEDAEYDILLTDKPRCEDCDVKVCEFDEEIYKCDYARIESRMTHNKFVLKFVKEVNDEV